MHDVHTLLLTTPWKEKYAVSGSGVQGGKLTVTKGVGFVENWQSPAAG
jgi:hypothetical protein